MKLIRSTLSIVLLLAFLSSTLGIQVYKHYCGNLLADISFFHKSGCCEAEKEESCAMKKEVSCCEDEFQFIQLDTDLPNAAVQSANFGQVLAFQSLLNLMSSDYPTEADQIISYESPPDFYKLPLYKRLNRLTLYA